MAGLSLMLRLARPALQRLLPPVVGKGRTIYPSALHVTLPNTTSGKRSTARVGTDRSTPVRLPRIGS
jgi:hypothetical protein